MTRERASTREGNSLFEIKTEAAKTEETTAASRMLGESLVAMAFPRQQEIPRAGDVADDGKVDKLRDVCLEAHKNQYDPDNPDPKKRTYKFEVTIKAADGFAPEDIKAARKQFAERGWFSYMVRDKEGNFCLTFFNNNQIEKTAAGQRQKDAYVLQELQDVLKDHKKPKAEVVHELMPNTGVRTVNYIHQQLRSDWDLKRGGGKDLYVFYFTYKGAESVPKPTKVEPPKKGADLIPTPDEIRKDPVEPGKEAETQAKNLIALCDKNLKIRRPGQPLALTTDAVSEEAFAKVREHYSKQDPALLMTREIMPGGKFKITLQEKTSLNKVQLAALEQEEQVRTKCLQAIVVGTTRVDGRISVAISKEQNNFDIPDQICNELIRLPNVAQARKGTGDKGEPYIVIHKKLR